MTVLPIFTRCVEAIRKGVLITRETTRDKEFHFQNWFIARLKETGLAYEQGGRNSYPDFRMVQHTDGYELKGLAYPGRDASFDSNSQAPTGFHNARTIYYVFGRYPKKPDGDSYPVLDLVVCHGDFLNADHEYVHKNKSVKGFGSYGDILIRDRKMYVVPTPFHLVEGAAHNRTLILPADAKPGKGLLEVGQLERVEAEELVVGYSFNLQTNELSARKVKNLGAGTKHPFRAWRVKGDKPDPVSMRTISPEQLNEELQATDEEADC
jgi:hypothetical protein